MMSPNRRSRAALLITALAAAACGENQDDGRRDSGRLDGKLTADGGASSLALTLYPATAKAYPGGTTLLLAQVTAEPATAPVSVTASASPAVPLEVLPASKHSAGVFEIEVRPTAALIGTTVAVEVVATSGALVQKKTTSLSVVKWDIVPTDKAKEVRALVVPWLAKNRSAFGISEATSWEELGTLPEVLVVAHYLYLSAEWELDLSWHVMTAPNDWAILTLRRRSELKPTFSAKLTSVSTDQTITEQTPPENVIR